MERTILLVEGSQEVMKLVREPVEDLGYKLDIASHGDIGLEKAARCEYTLIILNLSLPGISGLEICRRIREQQQVVPIIILSSRNRAEDNVLALELGADDYITIPFNVRELRARIQAQLRREQWHQSASQARADSDALSYGGLTIDLNRHKATRDGKELDLTPSEFRLLSLLASQPGKTLSKGELAYEIWGYQNSECERVISPHISRLRRKVERDPAKPEYIKTSWGIGFYFERPRTDR